uniref:Uncharacterized protein n=1 Tax=Inonotus obliquus TaxID=167356 RepID=A0A5A4UEE3_9AGAM|nr:hypothetical protein [Inonotus obliquus]BBN21299.1 hypothetical protein [Inonotus obliquus]
MYIGYYNYDDLTPILQKTFDILIEVPHVVLWKIPKTIFWDKPKKFVYDLPKKTIRGVKSVFNLLKRKMGIGSNRLPRPATDPNNSIPRPPTEPSCSGSTLPSITYPSSTPKPNETGIFSPITNWWKNYRRELALDR